MRYLKGSEYTTDDMVHNIREFVTCASDIQYSQGIEWYNVAAGAGVEFSETYGMPVEHCIGVIAALSPNNNWSSNVKDANTVLAAVKNGLAPSEVKVSTYDPNKEKAFQIAMGADPLAVLGGEKVTSFYTNILACYNGTLDKEVTVDMWALRVSCGVFDARKVSISDEVYARARRAYQIVADQYNVTPKQLQAVAWVVIRDLTSGIRDMLTHSTPMFCPNCFKAHNYITHS